MASPHCWIHRVQESVTLLEAEPPPDHPQVCLLTPPSWDSWRRPTLSPWVLFTLPVRPVSASREMSEKRWGGVT